MNEGRKDYREVKPKRILRKIERDRKEREKREKREREKMEICLINKSSRVV